MQLIFFLVIPLYLAATGRIRAEYDSASKAIVNCTFPENSTKRDFTVYFFYENGETELLVDCAWIGDKLECIEQRGFNCRLLVPNTAEIEVPQRYATRPSKIGYTLLGDNPDIVNFCHFVENSKESENKKQLKIVKENNNGHKELVIGLVIGAVLAVVVVVIGIVLYTKKCRRNTQTEPSEESDAGTPSLVSTENSSRDDKSSHSTVKYHVVLTEQSSSPINEEEKIPLNSQSVKDDNNIQVFIKEKNC